MLRVIRNLAAPLCEGGGYEKPFATPAFAPDLKPLPIPHSSGRKRWDQPCQSSNTASATPRPALSRPPAPSDGDGCDTTGVEPDFALVKFKTLAGGGYFKIITVAFRGAGISATVRRKIDAMSPMPWAMAAGGLFRRLNYDALRSRALAQEQVTQIEAALEAAFDIRFVFNRYTLGGNCRDVLKLDAAAMDA